MSTLHLVRHGRAGSRSGIYDDLHEDGVTQARLLGVWLDEQRAHFDAVFVGPLERHRATLSTMREAAPNAAARWPAAVVLEALTEAPYVELLGTHLPARLPGDQVLQRLLDALSAAADRAGRTTAMEEVFAHMVGVWERGEVEELETHGAFVERVRSAAVGLVQATETARDVLVVTSHGVIDVLVAHLLHQPASGRLRFPNASVTRLRREGDGFELVEHAGIRHLGEPRLVTLL